MERFKELNKDDKPAEENFMYYIRILESAIEIYEIKQKLIKQKNELQEKITSQGRTGKIQEMYDLKKQTQAEYVRNSERYR